jgi:hypothetical protein
MEVLIKTKWNPPVGPIGLNVLNTKSEQSLWDILLLFYKYSVVLTDYFEINWKAFSISFTVLEIDERLLSS